MDHIAIVGYSSIALFSLYKLADTVKRPVDFVANIALLIGLGSLIAYHIRKVKMSVDETNDETQRRLRLMAHSTITLFLVLTLTQFSAAKFQMYDWFALLGHASLLLLVLTKKSQLFGIGMLALYFVFATARKFTASGTELLNLVGRTLLTIFFVVTFIQDLNRTLQQ